MLTMMNKQLCLMLLKSLKNFLQGNEDLQFCYEKLAIISLDSEVRSHAYMLSVFEIVRKLILQLFASIIQLKNTFCLYSVKMFGLVLNWLNNKYDYVSRQTLRLDVVCGQPHHHHWLSAARGCVPSAIMLFRLLPHIFGTVCRCTSRLHPRCLFFAVV